MPGLTETCGMCGEGLDVRGMIDCGRCAGLMQRSSRDPDACAEVVGICLGVLAKAREDFAAAGGVYDLREGYTDSAPRQHCADEAARLRRRGTEGVIRAVQALSRFMPTRADEACERCGARMLYSARARGDGLCGPCHRFTTGTETEADRMRWGG